jgi:hypothetical protein
MMTDPMTTESRDALVEELARAACGAALGESYSNDRDDLQKRIDDEWRCWRPEARAILPIIDRLRVAERAATWEAAAEVAEERSRIWMAGYRDTSLSDAWVSGKEAEKVAAAIRAQGEKQ